MNTKFASLSFELKQSTTGFQLFPAGQFTARDGRPTNVPSWEVKDKFFANLKARKNQIVIDYEHQSLEAATNGKAAPAAGWVDPLKIQRTTDGVFVVEPDWKVAARSMIESDEYRYISPVFSYDTKTGEVLDLHSIALTNTPALDGMSAVALSFLISQENDHMSPEILKLLNLPPDADEAAVIDALKALMAAKQAAEEKLAENQPANNENAALKTDTANFVPKGIAEAQTAEIAQLKSQIAALTTKQDSDEREKLIQANLAKLPTPEQQAWARNSEVSLAVLKSFLGAAPELAALKSMQTAGRNPPAASEESPLEKAVTRMYGGNANAR